MRSHEVSARAVKAAMPRDLNRTSIIESVARCLYGFNWAFPARQRHRAALPIRSGVKWWKADIDRWPHDQHPATMKTIELDGSDWTERLDFWHALRNALGVIPAHGTNFAAFEDSIFYHHDMLSVRPPFTVIVRNPDPSAAVDAALMAKGWAEQREWKRQHYGEDTEAVMIIDR